MGDDIKLVPQAGVGALGQIFDSDAEGEANGSEQWSWLTMSEDGMNGQEEVRSGRIWSDGTTVRW